MSYYTTPYNKKYLTPEKQKYLYPNLFRYGKLSDYDNTYMDVKQNDYIMGFDEYDYFNEVNDILNEDPFIIDYNTWDQQTLDKVNIYKTKQYGVFEKYHPRNKVDLDPFINYYGLYD